MAGELRVVRETVEDEVILLLADIFIEAVEEAAVKGTERVRRERSTRREF